MNRSDDRFGIAFNWGTVHDDHGQSEIHKNGKNAGKQKRGTTLKLRAFVQELYQHGYYGWLPFTVSGFGTDEILKALSEQYRVLEYYSELRRALGKNPVAPFYLFSIPLAPSRAKLVGEPPDQGTIYPITAQVPSQVDREYLNTHLAPKALIEVIRETLITETIFWSMEESVKIKNGRGEQLAIAEGSSSSGYDQISSSPSLPENEDDPLVQQPQLKWILGIYCGNNEQKAREICAYFKVLSTDHLRMSHFRTLVSLVQSSQNGQNGKH